MAIIDFEHWRPIWNENFGSLTPYKKLSRIIEQNKHPLWTVSQIEKEVRNGYLTPANLHKKSILFNFAFPQ